MSSTYLSPPSIFTSKCVATIMEAYLPITALSVSEKLVYRFCFLAPYCLACFSNTFHGSVCFVGCKRSDPSVLVAGKWHSQTEILAKTGTHLDQKKNTKKKKSQQQQNITQLLKNNGTYSATFNVVILHKAGNIHYCCFSWNS